ncbi:MAG: hypothetical protein ACFFD4_32605 [Candidatus Odinarchaeota archaeon]
MKKIKGNWSSKKHLFEGKMRKYEKQLIEAFKRAGMADGHPKEMTAFGYVLIHYRLTQKQLRDLTGYSAGTVSSCTSRLELMGLLRKKKILGTRGYEYYAPYNILQLLDGWRITTLANIARTRDFFLEIQKKVRKSDYIFSRIGDMLEFLDLYSIVFQAAFNEEAVEQYNLTPQEEKEKTETSNAILLNKTYNEENSEAASSLWSTEEIEEDIVDYFLGEFHSAMFPNINGSVVLMLAYFFTRGTLTQKQLQEITGLSTGPVSQGVKSLLDWGFIEKSPDFGSRYRTPYRMKSIKKAFYTYFSKISGERAKVKLLMEKMRDELDAQYAKLNKLHGYNEVYSTLSQYLRVFPIHERAHELVTSRLESLGKKAES